MSQRSFFLVAVLLLLLISGGTALLLVLVRQEPAWYAAAAIPPGPERAAGSKAFNTEFFAVYNSVKNKESEPFVSLTDFQANSFFEEEFLALHYDRDLSMENISQPRIAFDHDHIKIGFRYGHGLWSSIVSIDLLVWIPASEPNVVALQLESFRAGAVPISAQSLLEEIAELVRKKGIEVNWYRHGTHPVALLRFQPDLPRPTFQLKAIQLKEHSIIVQWRMLETSGSRSSDLLP